MKSLSFGLGLFLAAAVAPVTATSAAAEENFSEFDLAHMYGKLEGGYLFKSSGGSDDPGFEFDLDESWTVGAALGYEFAEKWRAELTGSYEQRDLDTADSLLAVGGDVTAYTIMPMIYRDFDFDFLFGMKPFIGAGAGVGLIDAEVQEAFPVGGGDDDELDINLAWQATAGMSYDVSERTKFDVRYRYVDAGEYEFDSGTADYRSHAVLAGLRYQFGAHAQEVAAPAATAPVAPAAPEVMTRIVYFDFDESSIRPDAAIVLDEVADVARMKSAEQILVVGHTDRAGRASYNEKLAQRRAIAVRDALIARGVTASVIRTNAEGERKPAVTTADGVREQLNRRAEVTIEIR